MLSCWNKNCQSPSVLQCNRKRLFWGCFHAPTEAVTGRVRIISFFGLGGRITRGSATQTLSVASLPTQPVLGHKPLKSPWWSGEGRSLGSRMRLRLHLVLSWDPADRTLARAEILLRLGCCRKFSGTGLPFPPPSLPPPLCSPSAALTLLTVSVGWLEPRCLS